MKLLAIWVFPLIFQILFWYKFYPVLGKILPNVADDDIQLNDKLMNAFKLGRAALLQKLQGIGSASSKSFMSN